MPENVGGITQKVGCEAVMTVKVKHKQLGGKCILRYESPM